MKTREPNQRYDFIIVGAGVAGLTLAYQLLKQQKTVLIIERSTMVGGLAKSFHYTYNGKKFIFDVGPKRFHTEDWEVETFIKAILKDEHITIGRKSSVYLFNRYFNWPITTSDLFKLPFPIQLQLVKDVLSKLVEKNNVANKDSFEDYILSKYGKTLYTHFFKHYTERFLGIDATQVHADWATTGINRSIVTKQAKGYSIWELMQSVLLPKPVHEAFLYPAKAGFGYFTQRLAKEIKRMGGVILTSTSINNIDYKKSQLAFADSQLHFGKLIWTGNLLDLGRQLHETFTNLEYVSTIFYNILVKETSIKKDQWIYLGDKSFSYLRASIVNNFAPYLIPKGYTGLIIEKTCRYNDAIWRSAGTMQKKVVEELIKAKLITNKKNVKKIYIEKIKDSYPVYHLNYKKGFAYITLAINTRYPNIKLLGRSGAFWYNNSDHSIKAALGMAKYLGGISDTIPNTHKIFS